MKTRLWFVSTTMMILLFGATVQADQNPACLFSTDRAKNDLKQSLLERYGSSYSTIKMLLDAGMTDYQKLCSLPATDVNNKILGDLTARYYPNFSTIWMLYEHNIEAYNSLR